MAVMLAGGALLLDVGDFAAGGNLAIVPGDAPARQRPEPEEPNETDHRMLPIDAEQFLYRTTDADFAA